MSALDEMNMSTDEYVKHIKYKGVDIFVEKETPDEDNNTYSSIIYCGKGNWHEFEGSGLFATTSDAVDYSKYVIERDSVVAA